jgi:hypothetical protein
MENLQMLDKRQDQNVKISELANAISLKWLQNVGMKRRSDFKVERLTTELPIIMGHTNR